MLRQQRKATAVLACVAVLVGASLAQARTREPPGRGQQGQSGQDGQHSERQRVELVFALDTTGSMSALLEGAKQRIWSIVSEIAQGQPAPELRVGLVAYRDRSDSYVVRFHDLSTNIDGVFETLMALDADGGGDREEDVNQALHVALNRMSWTQSKGVLRVIFLVGDAPPHQDYQDFPGFAQTCKEARKRGVFVNAVRAGTDRGTERVWKRVASLGDGRYFSIAQTGGMAAVETPFDRDLSRLSGELDATSLAYGRREKRRGVGAKQAARRARVESFSPSAAADRAVFAAKAAPTNRAPQDDLLDAMEATGGAALSAVPEEELPDELQRMAPAQRRGFVEQRAQQRKEVRRRISELSAKRSAYIEQQHRERGHDDSISFDSNVVEAVEAQMERVAE